MPESWRIHTSPIIGIFSAREFPLYHTLGVMLASWRSVLSFPFYLSSKRGGHDQGKNYWAIRRQSATFSGAAHARRGSPILEIRRFWRRHKKAKDLSRSRPQVIITDVGHDHNAKLTADERDFSDEAPKARFHRL